MNRTSPLHDFSPKATESFESASVDRKKEREKERVRERAPELFELSDLAKLFGELRRAAGGGGYPPNPSRSDYDRFLAALDWARDESERSGRSARDVLADSIGNWLASDEAARAKGYPAPFWAADPGRWYAVAAVQASAEDDYERWAAEANERNRRILEMV